MRVLTLNIASGRDPDGQALALAALDGALAGVAALDADLVALQEVDAAQERSHRTHQTAAVASACGLEHWRFAPALAGTPAPLVRGAPAPWRAVGGTLIGPGDDVPEPMFGVALLSRRPVRAWHALALEPGIGRLLLRAPDPGTGDLRWWSFPDEPRVALAAQVEGGVTVAATHLSFFPPTAVRQLRRVRHWLAQAPGPVRLLVGDLNLPGRVPELVAGGRALARGATFPGSSPRLQLDHVLAMQGEVAATPLEARLALGDHRPVVVDLTGSGLG